MGQSDFILQPSQDYKLRFVKTHEQAMLPEKNHESDSGYDIFACEDCVIPACRVENNRAKVGHTVVPTGIKVANIPSHLWFRIEARSGLGFKYGIMPHFGIIDTGYRGDLGVKLYNLTDTDYEVKKGLRIAQLVLYPRVVIPGVLWADDVNDTERGEKGFGSSGK